MKLELYEEDLREECRNISTSLVGFEHLTPQTQEAVRAVGRATFYRNKGTASENYNAVYPPK